MTFSKLAVVSTITTLTLALASARLSEVRDTVSTLPTQYITIPIDHFNASDTQTFQNRFWVNSTWYQSGGPVIFYDAGEQGVRTTFSCSFLNTSDSVSPEACFTVYLRSLTCGEDYRRVGAVLLADERVCYGKCRTTRHLTDHRRA
jgi:hypothetical protein